MLSRKIICVYFDSLTSDEGDVQELLVEIERPCHQKRFLGGYRHRLTGVEYHHAAVQTLQKRRPDRGVQLFSRDTQVTTKTPRTLKTSTSVQETDHGDSIEYKTTHVLLKCFLTNQQKGF